MMRGATFYIALFLLVYMAGGKKAKHRDPESVSCLLNMCKVKPHYDLLADDMSCSKSDAPNYRFSKFNSVRRQTYMKDLLEEPERVDQIRCADGTSSYPKLIDNNKWRDMSCITYSERYGCLECPASWTFDENVRNPIGNRTVNATDPDVASCVPHQTMENELAIVRDYREAVSFALPTDRYCPAYKHRKPTNGKCEGKCLPNCESCRNPAICDRCAPGYVPTVNGWGCFDPADGTCDEGFFYREGRCYPCHMMAEGCRECDGKLGLCTGCDEDFVLLRKEYGQICLPVCMRGTYHDPETNDCADCPSWCADCYGPGDCQECAPGLYTYEKDKNETLCLSSCPYGTYPQSTVPMRCLPCDPACETCYGPTRRHCYACTFFGILTPDFKLAECYKFILDSLKNRQREEEPEKRNLKSETAQAPLKSTLLLMLSPYELNATLYLNDTMYRNSTQYLNATATWANSTTARPLPTTPPPPPSHSKRMAQHYIDNVVFPVTGRRVTIYGEELPDFTNKNLTERGRVVYSAYFANITDYNEYWAEQAINKTLMQLYPTFCLDDECLDNCNMSFTSMFHPCPVCFQGFNRDFRGYCVDGCPLSTFYTRHHDLEEEMQVPRDLRDCMPCLDPSRCKRCDWYSTVTYQNEQRNFTGHPALLINEPYRHTRQQELDDPSIMRIKCLEQVDDKREHKCFPEFQFLGGDGYCLPCHPECIGCVGLSGSQCKKCRHVMNHLGYCVSECPKGYVEKEVLSGFWVCDWPLAVDIRKAIPILDFDRQYQSARNLASLLIYPLVLILYCTVQCTACCVARRCGGPDNAELVPWGQEEKIRQHAIEDIAYTMSRKRAMLFGDMTSRRPARITSCDISHDDERNPLMNKHVLIRRAPRIKPVPKVSKEVVKPLSLSESETQPSHAKTPDQKPRKEKPESMKSYKELLFTPPNQELSLLLDATPVPTATPPPQPTQRIGESPGVYVTSGRMITDREQKKPTVTPLKSKTPLRTGRSGEEPKPPTRQLDTPEVVVQQLLGTDRRSGSRKQKSERRQMSPKRKTGDGSGRADRPAPIDTKSRPKSDAPPGSGSGRSGKSGRNQ